jgi:hypothetical protein
VQDVFNPVCAACGAALTGNTSGVDTTPVADDGMSINTVVSIGALALGGFFAVGGYVLYATFVDWEQNGGALVVHPVFEIPYRLFGPAGPAIPPLCVTAYFLYIAVGAQVGLPYCPHTPSKRPTNTSKGSGRVTL